MAFPVLWSLLALVRRFRRGRASMLVDRINDLRPHRDRQSVPHPFNQEEFGAWNRGRGVLAAFWAHQGIDGAVDDKSGRLDEAQPFLAAAGCENCAKLTPDAGRVEAALEAAFGARAVARLV